jgi:hypothetical protein
MAKSAVEQDTAGWHIYRWVIAKKGAGITSAVYIDENPTPVMDKALSVSNTTKKFLEFGDSSDSYEYGLLLDWLIWTTNGAFSPKQAPLPKELTGISKTKVLLANP